MLKYFSRAQTAEILQISQGRLLYWDRIGLVKPSLKMGHEACYDFQDLLCLRTVKKMISRGVPAIHLTRSLNSLMERFPETESRLAGLRVFALGDRVIASQGQNHIDSLSGQYLLDMDWSRFQGEVRERVDSFAATRGVREWYAEGRRYESDPSTHEQAMHAYRQVVKLDPGHVEALLRLATLYYKRRRFKEATRTLERALEMTPKDARVLFDLGVVLEESGSVKKSQRFYERALLVEPALSAAHYRLAGIAEKLGDAERAIAHWRSYLQLDSTSLHARIAHRRIELLTTEPS